METSNAENLLKNILNAKKIVQSTRSINHTILSNTIKLLLREASINHDSLRESRLLFDVTYKIYFFMGKGGLEKIEIS